MGIRFINNGKGGGQASSIPNIFVQENEPTIKKGIWLQTNKELEHIYGDDDIFIAGEWKPDGSYTKLPYAFNYGNAVSIGTNIYLFGGGNNNNYTYKYDTLTDTYTRLADKNFNNGSAVAVGENIYVFGGNNASRYNPSTDTYIQLTNPPYSIGYGSIATVGTDIYLFGGNSGGSAPTYGNNYAYKYDTLNDTYTQLANIPYNFRNGSATSVGTDIYLFGGYSSASPHPGVDYNYTYKYNTLTDTYTRLTNIPSPFYGGSVVNVGNNIYLFGSGDTNSVSDDVSYSRHAYKYDILNNSYTRLTNIPYIFNYHDFGVLVGTNIFLFTSSYAQVYVLESSTYENNSVVLAQGRYYQSGYGIELYNDELFLMPMLYAFADAWFYTTEDGIITDIPTYYGDGTEWIKFKN